MKARILSVLYMVLLQILIASAQGKPKLLLYYRSLVCNYTAMTYYVYASTHHTRR